MVWMDIQQCNSQWFLAWYLIKTTNSDDKGNYSDSSDRLNT